MPSATPRTKFVKRKLSALCADHAGIPNGRTFGQKLSHPSFALLAVTPENNRFETLPDLKIALPDLFLVKTLRVLILLF